MKLEQEPLISVIVPVYNVEPYLRQCLDSIVNQTYQKLEIILVDDGSTDTSGEICDAFAAADRRIKVIHKENGGLVMARKVGISAASGTYVAYVDADDWIDLDTYETALEYMQGAWPDMLIHAYTEEYETESVTCLNTVPCGYYDEARIQKEIYPSVFRNSLYSGQGIPPYLYVKLMKLEVLKTSQMSVYENAVFCEDDICTVHSLLLARSVMIVDAPLYHYRRRPGSSVSDEFALEQCRATYENLSRIFSLYGKEDFFRPQLQSYMMYILLMKQYELFLDEEYSHIPFGDLRGQRTALYGAGIFGREVYQKTKKQFPERIVVWVDRLAQEYQRRNLPVEPIEALLNARYDVILVAVLDRKACETIRHDLAAMGIDPGGLRFAELSPKDCCAADQLLMKE